MARGRERDVPGGRGLALADDLFDLLTDGFERDVQRLEGLGGDAFALVDQPEQDVLGADVVVVEHPGLFLRQDDDPSGSVGETFEHVSVLRATTRMFRSSGISGPRPTPEAPRAPHPVTGRGARWREYTRGPLITLERPSIISPFRLRPSSTSTVLFGRSGPKD